MTPEERQEIYNKEQSTINKNIIGGKGEHNASIKSSTKRDFTLGSGKVASGRYGELKQLAKYDDKQEITKAPASIINRYSLFKYKGMPWNGNELTQEQYNLNANSLNDVIMNPTASSLIEKFGNIGSLGMRYSWSDFLYAKYYGKIPNNYMVTLRRYPYPVADNILDSFVTDSKSGKLIAGDQPDIARAVTWMSESTDNKLSEILKFTTKLPWNEIESEIQTIESNNQGIAGSSFLEVGTAGFSGKSAASSFFTLSGGQTSASARQLEANAGYDPIKETYPNYIMGPLNIIDKILIRDKGLGFEQNFNLKFHYSLRSIGDIDPKMAMLDIMSNLLVLTYNTAPFFGGATRWLGSGKFGKPLGDHSKLESGDLSGFLKSIMGDIGNSLSGVFGDGSGGFSLDTVLGGLGDVAGDMLGGLLSKNLNTPQRAQVANAFLSGDPTGQWHITIGNPFNPICMIGNLCLEDVEWELGDVLGRDDFPTELIITVKLRPGRPRDSADIESMFNAGRGRLYYAPEGLDDVLNLQGKEPIKISGYSKNPDANGTPGEAFNQVRKDNANNEINWNKISDKDDFIENKESGINSNGKNINTEASSRVALLANNVFHVTEG